jgi:DNA mismatch repair endonuclease MutH
MPFGDLDPTLRWLDGARSKAAARRVVNTHIPGLRELGQRHGITVRTLPIDVSRRVIWPTKIDQIDFAQVARMPFHRSTIRAMLWTVLFVPIRKPDPHRVVDWRIESAFSWAPEGHELGQLDSDYEEIRHLIRAGRPDDLSSSARRGQGQWLMPKTSGRNNDDIVRFEFRGVHMAARRRAFFLRETLTQRLLDTLPD